MSSTSTSQRSRKISLIFSFLCISFAHVFGQGKTIAITGKVTDENGKPLPGVSVLIKLAKTGTISNQDGAYSLSAEENSILVFSSISYETQEIPVSNRPVIDVSLLPSNKTLNEVVVVGYGAQSKPNTLVVVAPTVAPQSVIVVDGHGVSGFQDSLIRSSLRF